MLNRLLLPNKYKLAGWLILIPATALGIFLILTQFEGIPFRATVFAFYSDEIFGESRAFNFIKTNITNTLVGVMFITGALLVAFSKEKNEDEYIAQLRLSSLLWAVLVNYILLLIAFLFIYGTPFLNVMLYNMFTVLIIFIVRFNYVLFRNAKFSFDEKHD
ncbi:MAG: hypothetical protein EOO10_16415 [Chitinophagaceae bacterium]|nr:MAG: hypothetical protein EOO10_16415 [Chitinophagaceae bacterium]